MIIRRTPFFMGLFLLCAAPFLIYKFNWLAGSTKTTGVVGFTGKSITGQLEHNYAVILFKVNNDTIWFNGFDNMIYPQGTKLPIRYQKADPSNARIDVFRSMWGDTLIYGGIPFIILLVLFLHPAIIPYRSKLQLSRTKPFVFIV